MPLIYVETNYLVGITTGRFPAVDELLNLLPDGWTAALPAMCVMEASTALMREKNWANGVEEYCRQQSARIRHAHHMPDARALERHLIHAQRFSGRLFNEMESRLDGALGAILDSAQFTLLPASLAALREATAERIARQRSDNLIAHVILDHARQTTDSKAFFSENMADFLPDGDKQPFRDAGVTRLLARWDHLCGWLESESV